MGLEALGLEPQVPDRGPALSRTTTRRLRLRIDPEPRSGAENMALDQTLLDRAESGEGVLRLYRWAPFCLSFGRNEPALRRYDRGAIEAEGLDVVRRPTGGRAVWHARELTYSIAAPIAWFGSLSQSYCEIHRVLARAITRLGASATLAPLTRTPDVGSGACFASPAGGEVLVKGRKLVGSAQLRQGSAFLQHGSILLQDDQSMVARVTRGVPAASDEITLSAALSREVTFSEMADALVESMGDALDLHGPPSITADPAHLARFRHPAWTWRR